MHLPPTLDEIKATVPVTYALHKMGYEPEERRGGDLMYTTPWRNDSNPSLACYVNEGSDIVDRWRDMAKGDGGDILDLIGMLDPSLATFNDRLVLAQRLHEAMLADTWVAPEPGARRGGFDVDRARAELAEWALTAEASGPSRSLDTWLSMRPDQLQHVDASWLTETFGVLWVDGEMKVPYWDRDGVLQAYKYRKPGEKMMSPSGSRGVWSFFYGEWADDGERPVVLCEGETDVWSGTHATGNYVFLGLPSGAGTKPEKLQSRLGGRRVLIALDGDEPGRDAALRWANFLQRENTVEIVPVPDGKDLSSVNDLPALLARARPFEAPLPGLLVLSGRYHRASKDGSPGAQLSDFELTPLRVLTSTEGGLSYEVTDGRQEYLLLASDLLTRNAFRRWAHERGMVWDGSDSDTAKLASRLKCYSLFCPVEGASDVAGLHDKHIVWEGGSIGDRPVRFVPTAAKVALDIRLSPTAFDYRLIHAMRELAPHSITDPILAWAAAAPFRSLLPQFPVLNVAGSSGSGKTTTVQAIIPTLTGSHVFQTLSSSTPYAVESIINSTNAFPVVFDEYRPGARTATLERLEQLARDAYDGTPSAKSAGGDRWNELAYIRTQAPIVIAGEQSITETSHAERMVLVHLVRPKVRNDLHQRALNYVRAADVAAHAHAYLRWVVREVNIDGQLAYGPAGPETLPDRVRYNLGILDLGWRALNAFLGSHGADPLSEPDWSGIIATTTEVTNTSPVIEALRWAADDEYASRNVWVSGDDLCVSAAGFVSDVKRAGVHVLPGNNAKTITDLLQADYGAYQSKRVPPLGSAQKRVWVVPASILDDKESEQ